MTDDVEWVGYTYDDTRKIPFSEEDPLIFHVLTSVPGYEEGESSLLRLMSEAAAILPRARARKKWGGGKGLIFARDEIAGDDEYIFMTPCNVYTSGFVGDHGLIAQRNPAVAFRLSQLIDSAEEIAFRVHDLEPQYRSAESTVNEDVVVEQIDWGDEDSEEIPMEAIEQHLADAVSEQIKAIADFGTQCDTDLAVELIELYARFLGAFRDVGWNGRVSESSLRDFLESVEALVPESVKEYWGGDTDYAEELMIDAEADTISADWLRLFGGRDEPIWGFPWALRDRNAVDRPEVMVKGELLLCDAAFYRSARGVWLPVPAEVCQAGRLTANRRVR